MNIDIADLLSRAGSTYKLVILASRRAIELSEGAARLTDMPAEAKVTNVAIQEISEGKITYKIKDEK